MTKQLAIGLVGCGKWGQFVLRDLKSLGASVTVAVASAENTARAAALGADRIVETIAALPADLAGYVVVTPTDHHAEVIEALIPRGKPIFVEKAMTSNVAAARSIVDQAGDRVFVMDKWRYHPGVEALRVLHLSGRLGRTVALHSYRWGWSTSHDELDPIWLLTPHDLAIAFHILGEMPRPVHARGRVLSSLAAELTAVLDGANGTSVHIDISSIRPGHQRMVFLVGDKGTAQFSDSYDTHLKLRIGKTGARDAEEVTLPFVDSLPLKTELDRFLKHLQGGPAPMSSAREGLQVVETIAALRSMAGLGA